MKSRTSSLRLILAGSVAALLAAPSAKAATFYWDTDGATAGFGTAATGAWAQNSTTTGRWSTAILGDIAGSLTQTTANTDIFNFGTSATALGATTITVTTVTMGNTTFGSLAGAIVLTGGTITFAAAPTITVNNASNTINSIVAGAATSFTKAGSGILILGGTNTYTGATNVNAGTLRAGAAAGGQAFGVNSAVTLANTAGVTLDLNGFSQTIGSLAGVGTTNGIVTLGSGSAVLTIGGNNTSTSFAGVISGTGTSGLTKNGIGTQTLTGANTYAGTTTINNGTIDLGGGTADGSLTSSTLTLAGGSFNYTRTGSTTQTFTTTNYNSSASTITASSGNIINLGTVARAAGATYNFANVGAGTVAALAASNTGGIMGGFTVGDSWAVANGAGVAISGLGSYTLTSVAGTTAGNYTGNNIDVDNSAGTIGGTITTNSLRFSANAANTLDLAVGTNTISTGGILVGSGVGANLSTISGGTLTGPVSKDLVVIQNNTSGGLTISSTIANSTSTSLTKSGSGLLTLGGNNTFTGGITINAGTVAVGNAGALNSTAGSQNAVTFGQGSTGTLALTGTSVTIGNLSTNATVAGTTFVQNANGTSVSNATLTVGNASNLSGTFAGTIRDGTGGGTLALIKAGTGTLTLSGANTYSGGTTLTNNSGIVAISNATSLGAGSVSVTGTSRINATGGITYANAIDVGGALTFGLTTQNSTVTYSGQLTGASAITITGPGGNGLLAAQVFTNTNNTFTGNVIMPAGNVVGYDTFSFASIGDGGNFTLQKAGNQNTIAYTGSSNIVFNTRVLNIAATANVVYDGGGTNPVNMFANNGSGTVTFNTNMTVGAVTTGGGLVFGGTNTGNNTFGGTIPAGSGGLFGIAKTNAGKWILTGSNSYTGEAQIRNGILSVNAISLIANNQPLGKNSVIQIGHLADTGTLEFTGATNSTTDKQVRMGNSNSNSGNNGGAFILNNGSGSLTFTNAAFNPTVATVTATRTLTLGGTYSGSGSNEIQGIIQDNVLSTGKVAITVSGSKWKFSNANTYTGASAVNAGTLELAFGAVASNILPSASALTLGGGTLRLSGTGTQTVAGLTTTASTGNRIILGASETLTLGALTAAGANSGLNFNTALGLADGATVGTGIVTLTGGTLLKSWTVTDSTGFGLATRDGSNQVLRLTGTTLLPTSGAASPTDYRIDNIAGSGPGQNALAVSVNQSAGSITVDTTANNGVLTLNSGIVLSNNTWNFGGTGTNTYQITGSAGSAGLKSVLTAETISINNYNGGTVTLTSPILAFGANPVVVNGTGTTVFAGANTYTGATTISGGGTLQLATGGSLTTTTANTYAGAIAIGGGSTLENAGSTSQTLSGAITGTGGTLKLSGTGQLILSSASNTYGALSITGAGRVFINSNAAALPAAATVSVSGGGILVFGTTGTYGNAITVGTGAGISARAVTTLSGVVTLPGTGTVSFNNDDSGTNTLAISTDQTLTGPLTISIGGNRTAGGAIGAVTLSGKLTGTGPLTVDHLSNTTGLAYGTGQLILSNATNDYTGGTTLNQGTLSLSTNGRLGVTTNALTVSNNNTAARAGGTNTVLNLATAVDTTVGSLSGTISPYSGANTATINNGGSARNFTINQTTAGSYAGVINGAGNFTLGSLSTNTLTLTGANGYTGSTTLSAGRLQLNGSAAGTPATSGITVASGAALGFTAGSASTLNLAGKTLSLGGTLAFDIGTSGVNDAITVNNFTLTGNSAFTFNPIGVIPNGGSYTLLTSTNAISNSGPFTISGQTLGSLTLTPTITANTVTLSATLNEGIWNQTGGGNWSVFGGVGPGIPNWDNYKPTVAGDAALFGSAILAPSVVAVDTAHSAGYLRFDNANAYTIGANGSSNLTLDNGAANAIVAVTSGSHIFAEYVALASNAFVVPATGTTLTVSGQISGAGGLGLNDAGTLALNGANNSYSGPTTVNAGTLSFTGALSGGGAITVSGNAILTESSNGVISGAASLTHSSSGTTTLSGVNTYTGLTTVTAGTLTVDATGVLGSGGGTAVATSGTAVLNVLNTNGLTGTSSLSVGTGTTAVLAAANDFSGATNVLGGTLQLRNAGSMGTSTITLRNNATLQLRNDSTTIFTAPITTAIAGAGVTYNFDVNNAGSGTGNTLTLGNITFAGNTTNQINVTGGNGYGLTLGTVSSSISSATANTMTFNATTAPLTIAGYTGGSFTQRLIFTGGNSITVNGTISASSNGSINTDITGVTTVTLKGAETLGGAGTTTNTLTLGTLNINHVSALGNVNGQSTLNITAGTIDNTSGAAITSQTGNPVQNWNGDFTFAGTNGANSNLNLGTGTVSLGSTAGATRTVTVTNASTNLTIGGVISNGTDGTTPTVNLTKAGGGTLTVSGANSYTGATQVSDGTLAVTGSLSGTTQVSVNNGATLLLNATGANNPLNTAAAVTVGGGTSGVLSMQGVSGSTGTSAGALALSANSTIDFGTGDSNTLTFASLAPLGIATGIKILNWTGSQYAQGTSITDPLVATQDRLVFTSGFGGTYNDGDLFSQINFYSDSGSSLVGFGQAIAFGAPGGFEIVPVPEPATMALIGAVALCALIGYRKRGANSAV